MSREALAKTVGAWQKMTDAVRKTADEVNAERNATLAHEIPKPFASEPTPNREDITP